MDATPGILAEVEGLGKLQFSPDEVALSVGIDRNEFRAAIKTGDNPLSDAFERGRLKSEAEVRRSILQLAKQGSSPAQKQVMDLIAMNKRELKKIKPA